jgi:predicted transcriptional regulator
MKTKARKTNFASRSTAATLRKQEAILDLLQRVGLGLTVKDVGAALGMSRQLALYHLKKMAAAGRLAMVLSPCERNGGVQFMCWDEMALAGHYTEMFHTRMRSDIRELRVA